MGSGLKGGPSGPAAAAGRRSGPAVASGGDGGAGGGGGTVWRRRELGPGAIACTGISGDPLGLRGPGGSEFGWGNQPAGLTGLGPSRAGFGASIDQLGPAQPRCHP
ncbi:hypothetical protein GUJ93_ZPchr0002g23419 [Zizania palustris]|uniref:Uncharacterized protein n=1 Tax=Zizania palustris TaxID=103762 RepID=A0A8J5VE32_ZIZPA|nr:hypothetical protein GUJ93_ZPchr0002g23419 [Zizania palustris]